MGLLICKNSLFCVPPIFKRYESAVLLPIFKWIAIFYYPFVNIRIANFAAINSRTFISKFSFFSNIPLQKASQHDFFAFVCINKFGSFCLSDLQLFNLKFSTHQRSFCLDKLFNTICLIPGMNKPGLVIIFIVVVNTLAIYELAELLG